MPRQVEFDNQIFEFDDNTPDEEAMNALDEWYASKPKYNDKQVGGLLGLVKGIVKGDIGISDIAKGTIEGFKELPELLDLAVTGKNKYTDPTSEYYKQDYGKSQEDAVNEIMSQVALGGRTFNPVGGTGVTGVFVGPKVIPKRLQDAFYLGKEAGKDKEALWKELGIYEGPDKKIRAELNDENAKLNFPIKTNKFKDQSSWDIADGLDTNIGNFKGKLSEGFKHDTLYALYPELKDTKLNIDIDPKHANSSNRGFFDPSTNEINITVATEKEARSTMLHEIQHKIQDIENFAKGGSSELLKQYQTYFKNLDTDMFNYYIKEVEILNDKNYVKEFEDAYVEFNNKHPDATPEMDQKFIDDFQVKFINESSLEKQEKLYLSKIKDIKGKLNTKFNASNEKDAYSFYRDLYGEIEARNVQFRDLFKKEGQKLYPPFKTEEKPRTGYKFLRGHKKNG